MPEEDPHVDIGRLRWPVTLETRVQQSSPGGTGIDETPANETVVHADIQGVGGQTFWGTTQVDTPITHRIFMRWQNCLGQTIAVIRTTNCPDGTVRREVFRVRRIKELGGRKRFVMIEAEEERFT